MLVTVLFVGYLFGLLALHALGWGYCLKWGLRWAKVQGVTRRRVVVVALLVVVLQVPMAHGIRFLLHETGDSYEQQIFDMVVTLLAAAVIFPCALISRVCKAGTFRSIQTWSMTVLATVGLIVLVYFVFSPLLFTGYVYPSMAMAPTIMGNHSTFECPQCKQPAYCMPGYSYFDGSPDGNRTDLICERFHTNPSSDESRPASQQDRIIVAKFLSPRRWEIVMFNSPYDRSTNFAKRVVGLPGETIVIKDGAVWADGKKIELPESLKGLRYLSPDEMGSVHGDGWGSPLRPATLDDDEYFVLGDFSSHSHDSRMWQKGAAGRKPFAVPESHIVGVVTHIYWPPGRMRVLR